MNNASKGRCVTVTPRGNWLPLSSTANGNGKSQLRKQAAAESADRLEAKGYLDLVRAQIQKFGTVANVKSGIDWARSCKSFGNVKAVLTGDFIREFERALEKLPVGR